MTPAHDAMRRAGAIVVDTFLADPCHNPMPTEEMLAEIGKAALLAGLRSLEKDGWVCVPLKNEHGYAYVVAGAPKLLDSLTGEKP